MNPMLFLFTTMDQEGQKPHHHIPWIAIALALLALVAFVFSSGGQQVIAPMSGGGYSVESTGPMIPKGIQVNDSSLADRAMCLRSAQAMQSLRYSS